MSSNKKQSKRMQTEHEQYLPPERILAEGTDEEIRRVMKPVNRRAFFGAGIAVLGGFLGWRWLGGRDTEDELPWPFRRVLETNERLARDYFSNGNLAATYDKREAGNPRVNGDLGLGEGFDPAKWSLSVLGVDDSVVPTPKVDTLTTRSVADTTTSAADSTANDEEDEEEPTMDEIEGNRLVLTMDEIRKLPYVEMVTELRCIEGWSQVVHWGGVRFADFIAKYPPATRSGEAPDVRKNPTDLPPYISIETPDKGYYVGLDLASALHPQTLLCFTMNGKLLTPGHGAPLRLVIPVKYGVKNIKRIGTIRYTSRRPADYWAEQGYDWYCGL